RRAEPGASDAQWLEAIRLHQRLDAVGMAENAAASVDDLDARKKVLAWAEETRRYHGLPRDALPIVHERDYLQASRAIDAAIRQDALDEAERLLKVAS